MQKKELIKLMDGSTIRMKKEDAKKIAKNNTVIDEVIDNLESENNFSWIELLVSENGIRYYIGNSIQELNNQPPISQESFNAIQWNQESLFELFQCYAVINYNIEEYKLQEYNGWINYYSWNIHLWITNNESIYNGFLNIAKCKNSKQEFINQIKHFIRNNNTDLNNKDINFILNHFSIIDINNIYESFQ